MCQASAHRAETCRFESCHAHVREHTLKSDHNMITVYGSHTHAIIGVAVCVVMVLGLVVCGCCVTCVVVMCRGVGGGHVAMAHVRMTAVPAAPTRACGVGVGTMRKRKKPPMGVEPMTIRLRRTCSAN